MKTPSLYNIIIDNGDLDILRKYLKEKTIPFEFVRWTTGRLRMMFLTSLTEEDLIMLKLSFQITVTKNDYLPPHK